MANSDKDILITPSTDTSNNPTISFVGENNDPITLNVLSDNSISFRSTAGDELYTLTSNLSSGNIFTISDTSGVPSLFANANGTVGIAPYYGQVAIGQGTASNYLDVYGSNGITSFTGDNKLGIAVRGSTGSSDYSGVDFYGRYGNQQDAEFAGYDRPFARIAARFDGSAGSFLSLGTSNSYATGITNRALTINPSGWVGVSQDPVSVMSVGTSGSTGTTRQLTIHNTSTGIINFGSYPGAWTSALMIQNNDNTDFIWISPIQNGNNARFRTGGTGLDFYISGGNNTGNLILALNESALGSPSAQGHMHVYGTIRQKCRYDNGRHYGFYTYSSTTSGTYYIHMKTNMDWGGRYIMWLIEAKGYAYGNAGRISCSWNAYQYTTSRGTLNAQYWTDNDTSSSKGMQANTTYKSTDNKLVLVGYTTGHYYIGFTLDGWVVNPTPGGWDLQITAATYSTSQTGVY